MPLKRLDYLHILKVKVFGLEAVSVIFIDVFYISLPSALFKCQAFFST